MKGLAQSSNTQFRKAMIGIFGLIFIGVASYWIYETDQIYKDLTIKDVTAIARDEVKVTASFQASILAFLVCALFHFSEKLS